jgi:hypothetical protein
MRLIDGGRGMMHAHDMDESVDAPEFGSREFWRRGHRRPWWQWNVLTLFAALFALVWARELLRLSQQLTWLISVCLLVTWFAAPALLMAPSREADAAIENPAGAKRPLLLAVAACLIIGLFARSGFLAGVLGCGAALLAAVAFRSRHD